MDSSTDVKTDSLSPLQIDSGRRLLCWVVFSISWLTSLLLWYESGIDKTILFALNNSNFSSTFTQFNQNISRYGMPVIVFIYLIHLLGSVIGRAGQIDKRLFLVIIMSFAVAGISGDILKEIFGRTRPIHEFGDMITFHTSSKTPAFPSGHATKSVALALPFVLLIPEDKQLSRWLVAVIALLVCFSRINLGAHYLSDVLAGIGWAFVSLPAAVWVSNKILSSMTPAKLETAAKIWIVVYVALIIFLCNI